MPTPTQPAFQERMPHNHCFGCGPDNAGGLQIKSHWADDGDSAECLYTPQPHMTAGPKHVLNGGIIATIIDCHCICTAVADAYRREGRGIGEGEVVWYVTGKLEVSYKRPTPIDAPVLLRAHLAAVHAKKSIVECELLSGDEVCASAELVAVRVPPSWIAP